MGCCRCWRAPSTKDAYRLSIASLIITLLAAYGGFVFAKELGSSLCLVYGLENLVDFISSAIVLWRFMAPWSTDDALERKLRQREQRASIAISFTMVLLGICIMGAALSDFARGPEENEELEGVIVLSFFSFIFFGTLTTLKFRYAASLDSESLYKDGICSLIGTVLAAALFVNILVVVGAPAAWWIDPTVALLAGCLATLLGLKALRDASTKQKLPIFTVGWWFTSKDEQEQSPKNSTVELPRTDSGDEAEII